MMQIRALSHLTGLSVRTLQYYDRIGLLQPAAVTEAGYRLYDEASLERLQQILLFRELEFPLKQIRHILDAPDFDRSKALEQQITLLTLKRDRLNDLIRLGAFECSCGKIHSPGVAKVIIEKGAVRKLPSLLEEIGAKKPFLLSGCDTFRAAGDAVCSVLEEAGYSYADMYSLSPPSNRQNTR